MAYLLKHSNANLIKRDHKCLRGTFSLLLGFNSGYGSLMDIINSADVTIHRNWQQFNKIYLVTHTEQSF